MHILVINGPNLNMLGVREPAIYGSTTYAQLEAYIQDVCQELDIQVEIRQSNHEGDLVDWIQQAYGSKDGIVIYPAAYTHSCVAILDALKSVSLPCVEVHLSDIYEREPFRHVSYPGMACFQTVYGQGIEGYRQAILALKQKLEEK